MPIFFKVPFFQKLSQKNKIRTTSLTISIDSFFLTTFKSNHFFVTIFLLVSTSLTVSIPVFCHTRHESNLFLLSNFINDGRTQLDGPGARNGYNGFLLFLPVFDMFEDEIGYVRIIIRCADFGILMKMSSAPSFGAPGSHIFVVVAS